MRRRLLVVNNYRVEHKITVTENSNLPNDSRLVMSSLSRSTLHVFRRAGSSTVAMRSTSRRRGFPTATSSPAPERPGKTSRRIKKKKKENGFFFFGTQADENVEYRVAVVAKRVGGAYDIINIRVDEPNYEPNASEKTIPADRALERVWRSYDVVLHWNFENFLYTALYYWNT